jgi:hypothetical protein
MTAKEKGPNGAARNREAYHAARMFPNGHDGLWGTVASISRLQRRAKSAWLLRPPTKLRLGRRNLTSEKDGLGEAASVELHE